MRLICLLDVILMKNTVAFYTRNFLLNDLQEPAPSVTLLKNKPHEFLDEALVKSQRLREGLQIR